LTRSATTSCSAPRSRLDQSCSGIHPRQGRRSNFRAIPKFIVTASPPPPRASCARRYRASADRAASMGGTA
jgi:hypothetical protein